MNIMKSDLIQRGLSFKTVKLFLVSLSHHSYFYCSLFTLSFLILFSSCSSDTDEYDPYHHWRSRNTEWYKQVADSAQTAIAQAKSQYGNEWEEHCDWRMIKSLRRSPLYQGGILQDSICVHILNRGTGSVSPISTDTVSIQIRGSLMPTEDANGKPMVIYFTQTYYGSYDPATAAVLTTAVNGFTDGVESALQYMVIGDDWLVYVPYELFYDSEERGIIPPYSAACFRINLVKVLSQRQ